MEKARPHHHDSQSSLVVTGRQRQVWLERFVLLAVLLCASLAIAKNHADADLWGHVTFGMNVLASGEVPPTATHTFTAEGYRWINHENLAEVALALTARLGGGTGLLIFKCAMGLIVLGLILFRAKRPAGIMSASLLTMVVAVNLTATWTLRPQLFSYTLFAVMIALLDAAFVKYRPDGEVRTRYLWAVVPLLMVWANSHGGFVAGYAVFGLYLVCRGAEGVLRSGCQSLATVGKLLAVAICGGLVTLLNPYGPGLHHWLLESLGRPRPEITEWLSLSPDSTVFWPFVGLAVLTVFGYTASDRKWDVTKLVLLAVTAWQSVEHVRHVPFLAILVGFWLPEHLPSACSRLRGWLGVQEKRDEQPVSAVALAGAAVICLGLTAGLWHRTRDVYVDKTEFPVDAIYYMAEHGLSGRLVVTYNWAQYALAALGPETTVAFDGRFRTCYPQEVVDMHFDFVLGDAQDKRSRGSAAQPLDGRRVLDYESPDLVLIDRSQQHSALVIAQQPEWVLLYEDGMAQVWGRKSRFDDPAHPDYLMVNQRATNLPRPAGQVSWPAFPARKSGDRHAATHIHGFPRSSS